MRETRGAGQAVPDGDLIDAMDHLALRDGVSASPEGAAPYAALGPLLRSGKIRAGESVLLYNTGTGTSFSPQALRVTLAATPPER